MNILHLNFSDRDGGAAIAAFRLNEGLNNRRVQSKILVVNKRSDCSMVQEIQQKKFLGRSAQNIDSLPLKFYPNRLGSTFSISWFGSPVENHPWVLEADIVNLHWVNRGLISLRTLPRLKKPLVWTLHDQWAFTGGCHYASNCTKYEKKCGSCPQLNSNHEYDLSRWVWNSKRKAYKGLSLNIVCISNWMKACVERSSLLHNAQITVIPNAQITVIPNGLNTNIYKSVNKEEARRILNLPKDEPLILFGAMSATSDPRKGFVFLEKAFEKLRSSGIGKRYQLVIFGSYSSQKAESLPFKTHYIGRLRDDVSLVLAYNAADVFVCPSIEDNLPNTVLEALSCGTPVVAFNVGGIPDMVTHMENGYLATPKDVEDLANGIQWVLENEEQRKKLSYNARKKIENEFTLELQSERYKRLYQEILQKK